MEKQYILKNMSDFNTKHIFECGQCFRWNKQPDGSYIGVFKNNVIQVQEIDKQISFRGICNDDIKNICEDYFDLKNNYSNIKNSLSKIDINMKNSISYGYGIRILHQDVWEMLISFIISANNNIPRIKSIIEKISKKYGKEIIYNNKTYYTFPTPEELSKATVQDLRQLGLGFRDKRVYEATKMVLENRINLNELEFESSKIVRQKLLELPGVGPKVADCIMLFALKKYEVFPIDVWVKRVIKELYMQENAKNKDIENLAKDKFGNLAGIAQQYLFYWRREKGA